MSHHLTNPKRQRGRALHGTSIPRSASSETPAFAHPSGYLRGAAFIVVLLLSGCGTANRNQTTALPTDNNVLERVTEKGPVKLVVRISPREPRLSDIVEMEVEVTAQPDVEIKPPAFGSAVGDFLVRDYTERRDVAKATPSQTRRFRYQLEPVHAGRHLIRSITIEFVDRRANSESKGEATLIESDPLEVNVTSELGDQVPNLVNLEPMLPPRPLPSSWHWSWYVIAAAAGIVAVVWIAIRRRWPAHAIEPRRQSPEEIAHAALAALLAENLPARRLFKEFYLRLTGIVRHYIEGTTGLRAPEQTTEEFLREIRTREVFPAERSARLKDFLEAADMVKYAGQQPDDDQIELSIARAREFVAMQTVPAAVAAGAEV